MKNSSSNARRIKYSVEFDFLLICYIRTILSPVLTYKDLFRTGCRGI